MLLVELALGVDHLRLNPETEPDALLLSLLGETTDAVGEFVFGLIPVAETLSVAVTGILVAEPSVVEQEHVDAEFLSFADEAHELVLVKVEICSLPVVEEGHTGFVAVVDLIFACPVVEVAARFSGTFVAEREDELRGGERFAALERVGRKVGVDAGNHTELAEVVDLESESEVSRPSEGAGEDFA